MTVLTDEEARALELPGARGALITSVDPASTADAAGIRVGDVIVEFFGCPIETAQDLVTRVALAQPGSRARVVLIRDGQTQAFDVDVQAATSPDARAPHRGIQRPANFGLTFEDVPSGSVLVREVARGSVAASAGLEPGDMLAKINTRAVRTAAEAEHALREVRPGSPVFLVISREGVELLLELHGY